MTPTVLLRVARLAAAAALAAMLITAAAAGVVPWVVWALSTCAFLGGLWRPELALPWLLLAVPWGERLAGVPVRATETLACAFLAGWCLRFSEPRGARDDGATHAGFAALVVAAVVVVSWARVAFGAVVSSGLQAARVLPADYLVTAGRDPHTAAALQLLLGVAMFLLVRHLVGSDAATSTRVLRAVALSGVLAAVASIVAVPVVYYLTGDYNEIDRYISVTRSRGAFHLRDVNAAGSHYILAGIAALCLVRSSRWSRRLWPAGLGAIVVAIWMSGSRAAMVSGGFFAAVWVGAALLAARGRGLPQVSRRVLGAAAVGVLVVLTASATLGSADATMGSASRSLSLRGEFLQTSLTMFATAPIAGVGIGTYYQRSNAFMPPGIRAIYGHENAHNYFMQVAVELGVVGLAAFLWWLGAALGPMWAATLRHGAGDAVFAAFLSCAAYLLTSVTGHPFLVVEAALPFWALLGAATGMASVGSPRP